MKGGIICLLGISTFTALVGCNGKSSGVATGAIIGGGAGAGIGAIAGGGKGAIIGGATGAFCGALIGALSARERSTLERRSPVTYRKLETQQRLNLEDIKNLSKEGVSEGTIINIIRSTNSYYNLSEYQRRELQNFGVSPRVIDALQTPYPSY